MWLALCLTLHRRLAGVPLGEGFFEPGNEARGEGGVPGPSPRYGLRRKAPENVWETPLDGPIFGPPPQGPALCQVSGQLCGGWGWRGVLKEAWLGDAPLQGPPEPPSPSFPLFSIRPHTAARLRLIVRSFSAGPDLTSQRQTGGVKVHRAAFAVLIKC